MISFLKKIIGKGDKCPKTKDSYVDDCFQTEFKEVESESFSHLPEFQTLIAVGNHGDFNKGLSLAKKLKVEYPTSYLPYFWL